MSWRVVDVRLPLFTVLLGSVNVALAALLVIRTFAGWSLDALTIEESPQRQVEPVPVAAPPAASFDAIQAQAVFHKSRSFHVAVESPAVQQPPPDYRLAGSMAIPNQPRSAVLVGNQSNARVKVVAGDMLDGWTVADVTSTHVVVQLGERTEQIGTAARQQSGVMKPSGGMVHVLGSSTTSSSSSVVLQPHASVPADSAPRLYRPPVPQ